MEKQQTLAKPEEISGIALHTGVRAVLRLNPAPENTGILFRRVDMPGSPVIPAVAGNVIDVQREPPSVAETLRFTPSNTLCLHSTPAALTTESSIWMAQSRRFATAAPKSSLL